MRASCRTTLPRPAVCQGLGWSAMPEIPRGQMSAHPRLVRRKTAVRLVNLPAVDNVQGGTMILTDGVAFLLALAVLAALWDRASWMMEVVRGWLSPAQRAKRLAEDA